MHCRPLSSALLAASLLCAFGTRAQRPWSYQQVSTADGLTDNAISRVYQDRAGFLWIGTENGLNKYDGHHVWTWRRGDGLGGDQVSDVIEDGTGIVWVATRDGGLTRLDPRTGGLRAFRHDAHAPASIASDRLTRLFDLNDTTLMIGAEQVPIMFLDKRTLAFTYWSGNGPITPRTAAAQVQPGANWCHSITPVGSDRLAIGFLLAHAHPLIERGTGHVEGTAFAYMPGEETITDITPVGAHLCGVGWQPSLLVRAWPGDSASTYAIPLPDQGTALLALDNDRVLIGTRSSGLITLDLRDGSMHTQHHRRPDRRTVADDRIRCLLRGRDGRIWVGTQHGLSVYDPASDAITAIPLYPENSPDQPDLTAYAIARSAEGLPLLCTSDGLFFLRADGSVVHQQPAPEGPPIRPTGVFRTPLGTFVGAEEGVFGGDPERTVLNAFARHWGVRGGGTMTELFQVRDLYADTLNGHSSLVVGVAGYGLTLFDLVTERITFVINEIDHPRSIGNNLTRQVLQTGDGRYWVATAGGLYRWELDHAHPANTFTAFRSDTTSRSLPGNDVQSLIEGPGGVLYVATRDGGLCRIVKDEVERLPCPRTLGNSTLGLAFDPGGRLWCTTADGLEVFDPRDRTFLHVPVPGMTGPATLSGCIATAKDGRIAVVAENTLHLIDPARMPQHADVPAPYVTGLGLFGKDILHRSRDARLELGPDERMLNLALSALRTTGPEGLSFAVRMEGVDPAARATDAQGRVAYGSLPTGEFRVFARTIDGNGRVGAEVLLLTVHVAAPIWQRWWFLAITAALVGAAVWAWSRYRIQQALKLHAVRDRIASDLHDEVGSSLSAISIGSQLAAQLSTKENEQVKQLMARIGRTSSDSLRSMSDIVWAIDPKNDEGDALVKRMRRISAELLEEKGIAVGFTVGGGVEDLRLPMNSRKELLLLFKEAVHNISKHADARHVTIALGRAKDTLTLAIEDDGRGFEPGLQADGHGLGSMRRRAEALGALLEVDSTPGAGTRVLMRADLTRIRD